MQSFTSRDIVFLPAAALCNRSVMQTSWEGIDLLDLCLCLDTGGRHVTGAQLLNFLLSNALLQLCLQIYLHNEKSSSTIF